MYAGRALRDTDTKVTLVDRRNFHLFQPLLYQVATAGLSPGNSSCRRRVTGSPSGRADRPQPRSRDPLQNTRALSTASGVSRLVVLAMASVLGPVRALPAGRTFYVAGGVPGALDPAGTVLAALEARGVPREHLTRAVLTRLLSPSRLARAERWASLPEPPDRDLAPTTYQLALAQLLAEYQDLGAGALGLIFRF